MPRLFLPRPWLIPRSPLCQTLMIHQKNEIIFQFTCCFLLKRVSTLSSVFFSLRSLSLSFPATSVPCRFRSWKIIPFESKTEFCSNHSIFWCSWHSFCSFLSFSGHRRVFLSLCACDCAVLDHLFPCDFRVEFSSFGNHFARNSFSSHLFGLKFGIKKQGIL